MPRFLARLFAVVVVLAALTQLLLPGYYERRAESRLEEEGGDAEVSVTAFPAVRLLFADGDSFDAEGRGLSIELTGEGGVIDRIDGFDRVRIELRELAAEPLAVERFELARDDGDERYRMQLDGTASPRAVARYLGERAGGSLGGLLGDLAGGVLPGDGVDVPVELSARLESRGGSAGVTDARATVAGIPAGPLAELVVGAVVGQL